MVFVDCRVLERKGGTASLIKLLVKEEELLINIVNKAISKLIKSTNIEHINDAFKRIKAITCNGCNLSDFLIDEADCNLHALNSSATPIFDKGIDVVLSPIEPSSTNTKKNKTVCAHSLLMNKVHLELKYLSRVENEVGKEPEINEQVLDKLYELFEEIALGYWSNDQKIQLTKNAVHLMKSLCFIQKHWKVLLRADYPHIPDGEDDFASAKLLNAITGLTPKKKNG